MVGLHLAFAIYTRFEEKESVSPSALGEGEIAADRVKELKDLCVVHIHSVA
jgi:hypothetical protein